jgi:outer membrane protein
MNVMIARKLQVCAAVLAAASMTVSPLYAQTPVTQAAQGTPPSASQGTSAAPEPAPARTISIAPDYSKGQPWFPNVIAPYTQRHILETSLNNTPKVGQLVQDGKLNLTLEDAISLALENNLDIAVQRYTPWLDQMQLLSARSGAGTRLSFDPIVTANINTIDATQPVANPLLSGVGTTNSVSSLTQHTTTGNFGYQQGFVTGTNITMNFNNSRSSSTTSANVFNPSLSSTLSVSITQPLLNGFGYVPNARYIIEAKNTVQIGQWAFKLAVINDVTKAATDYWNLVYARQNVKVEQQTVDVDTQLYNDNKKQLEIGTMAPLDVLTAESQLASDQQQLIVARTLQLQDETQLLNDITKDPTAAGLENVEVVPTTPISDVDTVGSPALQDLVNQAWNTRPELQEMALQLKNDGVEVQATRNGLLPSLNLVGQYSSTGLGGVGKKTTVTPGAVVPNLNDPILLNGVLVPNEYVGLEQTTSTTTAVPGGIGDAWDSVIHSRYPTFQVGVQLNLPIRNRAAQAANGTALLNQSEEKTSYQEEKNVVYVAVRNALIAVQQDRSAMSAAQKARELAQQTFDDEQKKYQLGSSTSYNVVLRSRDLTAAETTELQDRVNLVEAILALDQAMGRTLEIHNISLADAKSGKVTAVPNIPGTPTK